MRTTSMALKLTDVPVGIDFAAGSSRGPYLLAVGDDLIEVLPGSRRR
jgi:hypothetical protein